MTTQVRRPFTAHERCIVLQARILAHMVANFNFAIFTENFPMTRFYSNV